MTGYQEIFTDPSYFGQIMVTTNAHIGNYGVSDNENQSKEIRISGLICKNFNFNYSRANATKSLFSFLETHKLVTVADVDTRALVHHIRKNGAMNAVISTEVNRIKELKKELEALPDMEGLELASKVSTTEPYYIGNSDSSFKIAVLDLGIKTNILEHLVRRDCYVKVFPYNTSFNSMEKFKPDGYFISNGPGDPAPLKQAQEVASQIIEMGKPLFGICLGHQVIALANGIPTYKMFNGHRGINHPVKNLMTGKGEITSQNHGFAVDREAAEKHSEIEITYIHLNDNTVAGLKMKNKPCFSVQYHPEAGPGPNDATYLFDVYLEILKKV